MTARKKTNEETSAVNGYPSRIDKVSEKGPAAIEIDVFDVMWTFLVNWWKIAAVAVAGAVLAFVITFLFVDPTYTATSSIYIVSASSNTVVDLTELQLGSNLSDDYLYLMTARPLMETVAEDVGEGQTWKTIKNSVSVSNNSGDRIITISVTTENARLSADIANSLAQNACEYLPDVTSVDSVPNVIETALVPTGKSGPSITKNVLIGFLAGAVLVCGVLFLKYLLNDTFIVSDDLVSYYGMSPLSVIPEGDINGNRKGKKRYGYYYSNYGGNKYATEQKKTEEKK